MIPLFIEESYYTPYWKKFDLKAPPNMISFTDITESTYNIRGISKQKATTEKI